MTITHNALIAAAMARVASREQIPPPADFTGMDAEATFGDPGLPAATRAPVFSSVRTGSPDGPSVEFPRLVRLIREINGYERKRVRAYCELIAMKAQEGLQ
jgi:hypothetical protein